MSIGFYNNFPSTLHFTQNFLFTTTNRQLQQRIVRVLGEINRKETNFEELAIPTIPNGAIIFEFGIADMSDFTFLGLEEVAKVTKFLKGTQVDLLDFFCSIRYYRINGEKRQALKFDYYMLRLIFVRDSLEVQVFHERGPRYLSPEDLVRLITDHVNHSSCRKILTETET